MLDNCLWVIRVRAVTRVSLSRAVGLMAPPWGRSVCNPAHSHLQRLLLVSTLGLESPRVVVPWRRSSELLVMCVCVCVWPDDPENNRRVLDDTVVLHNAGPEDTAVYQCDASNGHGGLLANINIMVMSELDWSSQVTRWPLSYWIINTWGTRLYDSSILEMLGIVLDYSLLTKGLLKYPIVLEWSNFVFTRLLVRKVDAGLLPTISAGSHLFHNFHFAWAREWGARESCSTHGVVILPLLFKGSCPVRKYFADQLLEQRHLTSSVVPPGTTVDPALWQQQIKIPGIGFYLGSNNSILAPSPTCSNNLICHCLPK